MNPSGRRNQLSLIVFSLGAKSYHYFLSFNRYVQVLIIFGLSRLFGWALFTVVGRQQTYSPWGNHSLDYLSFVSIWDVRWYQQVAETGYPTVLPIDAMGKVAENPWAFYPLYPYTVAGLEKIFGSHYYAIAATLSLLSGFVAACLLYKLFRDSLAWVRARSVVTNQVGSSSSSVEIQQEAHSLALWAVAVFAFCPVAPVLQVPYAEAYNLIFLVGALLLLMNRHYGWAVVVSLGASLSRPVGVPLGATAGLYWLVLCVQDVARRRRAGQTMGTACFAGVRAYAGQLVSALAICATALMWPLIAWLATGKIDAYTATETAWRGTDLYLVAPWIKQSVVYFGWAGPVIFVGLVLGFFWILTGARARAVLHPVLVIWCMSYGTYLVLFLNPQSSLFRMLLPLFPLALWLVSLSTSRAYRMVLVGGGAILQFGWVGWLWHWKELPQGGDYPP